ncbi:MAG: glutamine amidotransferase [Candidatus Tokpelaia sp. JSC085]|nr:MAG: glutamine amidotransferase [Candidatus Tokpelaia sp. JSC085]
MLVAIIDYGSGNLRSVAKAFGRAANERGVPANIEITNEVRRVRVADRIVLPGVGAYADCRRGLDGVSGMVEALEEIVLKAGKPFLGICVGMQLLSTRGLEKEPTQGLDWIKGDVIRMNPMHEQLKVPQIGWNTLELAESAADHTLFKGIPTGPEGLHAYFLHSYHFNCTDKKNCLATANYGGKITAVVSKNNVFGTQFHPEKSQRLGIEFLANFLEWKP